ncbi:MAG: hypothetical protein ABSH06_31760 [Thermodesulfobacteriota bacterium]
MKQFRISFLVVAFSLMLTGMAFALDIPNISTWTQSMGVGGGGPGLGDLLIAPFYDVRNLKNPDTPEGTTLLTTQDTLIGIVNTDEQYGCIARVRFREWKRSREVLDFDIPLSCNDVWVGEVSRLTAGGGIINSPDRWISATRTDDWFPSTVFPTAGIPFKTDAMGSEGTAADRLARTEYGYFEIIGEERVACKMTTDGSWLRTGSVTVKGTTYPAPGTFEKDVKDTLMGNVYLIRPEAQISHEYNMNAYSEFAVKNTGIWSLPLTGRPNLLQDVQGVSGTQVNPGVGGFDQLEAIMSKRYINFQYVDGIDDATGTPTSTSVVITFPTKQFHYDTNFHHLILANYPDWAPFTGYHETRDDGTAGGEVVKSYIYDRAENLLVPPEFPVSPGLGKLEILPWEVNVVGLLPVNSLPDPIARGWRDNLLLATQGATGTAADTFKAGWVSLNLSPTSTEVGSAIDTRADTTWGPVVAQGRSGISFSFFNNFFGAGAALPAGQVQAGAGQYRGLPAVGIVMTEFYNDTVKGYYGNTVPWQYEVDFGDAPTL